MTPSDLKSAALKEIGKVAFDETAPAEEFSLAGEKYVQLHSILLDENLATWAVDEDIPDNCSVPVTWMLCNLLTGPMQCENDVVSKYLALGSINGNPISQGERQLRRILAADYVPQVQTAEYF